ncbi:uncharacterized protein LOC131005975 [Salvia miltiorrhiza]|uniref:uncharacterized protein LOC131005975 n=1 Tax=Salvia miltiorrhiza TaxID=226208 RepID=UPI0025AB665F|nr:uncharacterized protein LOC131005975 [Salvia miltiorrhiza]
MKVISSAQFIAKDLLSLSSIITFHLPPKTKNKKKITTFHHFSHPSAAARRRLMEEKKSKSNKNKKPKHQHPNDQTAAAKTDLSFKPSADVKGLRFGGQFIVKSFTVRRARPLELLRLLALPPARAAFASAAAYLPTNFTILAHRAWHTLTLGLGTRKSKVVVFVFESEAMRAAVERLWPAEIPLGEVNRKLIRGLAGCEMARFKFRKGCVTFYVYAVRRIGDLGFVCAEDLRSVLQAVVALKDFIDHTAMLALPEQRSIGCAPPLAVAH